MDYRVEELAKAGDVAVDTVRYYQSRGLLPPPRRQGRIALYGESHLERLRRIRRLLDQGLTLALIGRVLDREAQASDDELLDALVSEQVGERTLTREELARESGVPEALIAAARSAGLVAPLDLEGEERYSVADLEMARAALEILSTGFPLPEILGIAVEHARNVQAVTDRAIDLFDAYVREAGSRDRARETAVSDAFRRLLPQVTRLVALHFQRTLTHRALTRLRNRGAAADLRAALAVTEERSLDVSVAWR
jgi:DNA-binding transcriptional MerR regulator